MTRIAAELHCHTWHSDARFSPDELAQAARDEALDVLALTDHNTQSGWADMEKTGFPFIRGIEWTTFYGHLLVLGAREFVDWRDAAPDNIDEKIAQVKAAGGTVGMAHPFAPGSPMCTGCYWDFMVKDWRQMDYIEVWNEELPPLAAHNRRAVALWRSLLDKGYRIAPTYGRDWHAQAFLPVPRACTYLEAENGTAQAALAALRAGRTLLSMGPDIVWTLEDGARAYAPGDTLPPGAYTWSARVDRERRRAVFERFDIRIVKLVLLGKNDRVLGELTPGRESTRVTITDTPYARLEALGAACGRECPVALSAPVYVGER